MSQMKSPNTFAVALPTSYQFFVLAFVPIPFRHSQRDPLRARGIPIPFHQQEPAPHGHATTEQQLIPESAVFNLHIRNSDPF